MHLDDFTSRSWKEFTPWEWRFLYQKNVVNGCGGSGDKIKQRVVRWFLKTILKRLRLVFIESSCDIHDFSYWQGGDERRRYECDLGFFQSIISDIGKSQLGGLSVLKYTILALCFYYSVRVGGKDYFRYH